jgi:hypothetical protein
MEEHKDRRRILAAIGGLLLLVGLGAGLLGPIELYCFYLFSEGGRFYYPGFGFGSFMFGNIAAQIIGYYLIALLLIPLGYGHLALRRWARPLALTLLWAWLVVGAPLAVIAFAVLLASKDLGLAAALVALIGLALSYLLLPWLMIRFYRSRDVRLTFERDPNRSWLEKVPQANLLLAFLYLFYAAVLHIPIFFRGLFPLFGRFVSGQEGILLLTASMAWLVCLAWGTLKRQMWAWWAALVTIGLLTLSLALTLVQTSYAALLATLQFPPREIEFLAGIPAQGYHFAILLAPPLLLTLVALLLARRQFRPETQ